MKVFLLRCNSKKAATTCARYPGYPAVLMNQGARQPHVSLQYFQETEREAQFWKGDRVAGVVALGNGQSLGKQRAYA